MYELVLSYSDVLGEMLLHFSLKDRCKGAGGTGLSTNN